MVFNVQKHSTYLKDHAHILLIGLVVSRDFFSVHFIFVILLFSFFTFPPHIQELSPLYTYFSVLYPLLP